MSQTHDSNRSKKPRLPTRMLILLVSAVHLAFSPSASAFYLCTEPYNEPWCLSESGSFTDEFQFDDCRRQVNRFIEEINEYIECLAIQLDNEQEEQIERANRVIRRFNCGAQSGEACW